MNEKYSQTIQQYKFKDNNDLKLAILNFIELRLSRPYPSLKPHILFYCNGLVIWHGLPDIKHNKVNYGRYSAIFNLIKLKCFRAYPFLKPHNLFYSIGSAICTVCQISGILKFIMSMIGHFEFLWGWKFARHIPTWNCLFCFIEKNMCFLNKSK